MIDAARLHDLLVSGLAPELADTAFGAVAIVTDHEVVTVTTGSSPHGATFTASTPIPVYCAGRVPLQLLAASTIEERFGPLHEVRIGDVVDEYADRPVGELTVDDVFAHRGGLYSVDGVLSRFFDLPTIEGSVAAVERSESSRYSDYAAGHLMGRLVETSLGVDHREACAAFAANDRGGPADPITTFVDVRTGVPLAALGDITGHNLRRWNPSFGWYDSARGLATSAHAASARIRGMGAAAVADAVRERGSAPWDPGLERSISLGVAGHVDFLGSGVHGLTGQGGISFCGSTSDLSATIAWTVSPALPTPAALARSSTLLAEIVG